MRRRAYSLIEILVVIAAGTTMMGIALGLLSMLIRLEEGSRDEVRRQTVINRLADQFRRDVHAADRLTVPDAPGGEDSQPVWQFPLQPEHVVEYRAGQGELVRMERADGEPLNRESFLLPTDVTVSIELVGDAAPGIVSMQITPEGNERPGPTRPGVRVDAELGKDRRFVKPKQP